ncbi:MAG: hypothetical protein WC788_00995 [Candidatus Paceibacterota bacterium]|jgi:hypothetical protein
MIRIVIYGMYKFKMGAQDFADLIMAIRDGTVNRIIYTPELKLRSWDVKFALPKDGETPAPGESIERDITVDISGIAAHAAEFEKAKEDSINMVMETLKKELLKTAPEKTIKRKWWQFR